MNSSTIRQKFIDFFIERGHLQLPSLSLIPSDPSVTTLFTIAGMQQMIPYFMGREDPPSRRIITDQRTVRTVDIDEVGDFSHLTLIEMLGNFSVGDYFKHEAIAFTWDFLTKTMEIPADRWWATIYPGDEEARQAWLDAGLPADRIVESEKNWWDQGPVGPCGPDSEIHYDRGPEYGCGRPDCRPEQDCCERFLEVWNNVFMVYFQEESGERRPLPWRNIDTGMGLERLVTVVQGGETVYDTDLFQPIISAVTDITGVPYKSDPAVDRSLRIISDHCRAITFIIADGVMPSAEGRGYVLRRLLRRAALHGRLLGIDRPFLQDPIAATIDVLGGYWKELPARRGHIMQVVGNEERRFLQTVGRGLGLFEDVVERAAGSGGVISGSEAFMLSDTYGFPLELTVELAADRGLTVDRDGYAVALREQQERGRRNHLQNQGRVTTPEGYADLAGSLEPTEFTGYDELQTPTEVVGILANGQPVTRAEVGDEIEIVLTSTPFYAEAGGQVGDQGWIRTDSGSVRVEDTQRPVASLIVHRGRVEEGAVAVGDAALAEVDAERRLHIVPHHSATHLLHKALQEVLGPEATQAGSLVAPDRLRFDFRWSRPMTADEIREVQDRVNAAIWANLPVTRRIVSYDEAIQSGAMALFGEKYGDRVRVISMGEWSKELCGGTHVNATGDIGLVVITGETGIGSGVRRIEALAGAAAYAYVQRIREQLAETAGLLDVRPEHLISRVQQLSTDLRDRERQVEALTQRLAAGEAEKLLRDGVAVDGFTVVAQRIAADSVEYLQATADALRAQLDRGIVVLGTVVEGKPQFTMAVTRNLKDRGFQANALLREAARSAQGGAGGTAEFAHGGGRDASKVQDVLETAVQLIRKKAEE